MTDPMLDRTRRALHAVAELVLAGPQHRMSGTIKLRVARGGFRTVAQPELRVDGIEVIARGSRTPISGSTARSLAASVGVDAGEPEGVYEEGSGVALDDLLVLDPAATRSITDAYTIGDAALRLLAPDEDPVLWPEHFDVGIRVDAVNFGISPGDGYLGEPYAYVGVDSVPADPFWNAPFGTARVMSAFGDAASVRDYFLDARDRHARVVVGSPESRGEDVSS